MFYLSFVWRKLWIIPLLTPDFPAQSQSSPHQHISRFPVVSLGLVDMTNGLFQAQKRRFGLNIRLYIRGRLRRILPRRQLIFDAIVQRNLKYI